MSVARLPETPAEPIRRLPSATAGGLVLGGDHQGLGIVRSLGRHGIPVCVIDDEPSISRFSRYTTRALTVPALREPERIAELVLDVAQKERLEGWVVYPTRDEMVVALSMYRDELADILRVPTPAWETVRHASDKRRTAELAQRLGIPTPRTWSARTAEELGSLDIVFPVALKPAIKEHFIYETNVKAIRADTAHELATLFSKVCTVIPPEEVLIQELIPGGGECQFSYCTLFKDGPIATMLVRRTRQRPPDFGRSSTFVETIDLPEIEEPSERLLKAIGYHGLAEVEYKLDRRTGEYKLLDINLRTWGYHTVGPRAGTDFPYLLFRDQLEQPVTPCRAAPGVSWIRLSGDLPTSLREAMSGRLAWRSLARSLLSFDCESVFAKDDVRPALAELSLLPHLYRTRADHGWQAGG